MESIKALSVLDGRYRKMVEDLSDIFSEYGLIKYRVQVEIKWLEFLVRELKIAEISDADTKKISHISDTFSPAHAEKIKEIEKETNHDVKAVEYFIKATLDQIGIGSVKEWVHFSCTSDDINNTAYALMTKAGKENILKSLSDVLEKIESLARQYKSIPMISRTHGQPASPTTVGKELVNFAWRIKYELENIKDADIQAKINGATGNYNAHYFVFPDIDWIAASERFLSSYLEVTPLLFTTQINPNNYLSNLLHGMIRVASIIIDFDRDMWGYISLGYFKQKVKAGEVGSSTMPHKVNPIDFENSEGNMGVAISMMEHLSVKLLNSRFQRDLTDSTVLRNLGAVFGYFKIGLLNALKGLTRIEVNTDRINEDIEENLELLAEPIQTMMRVFGEENPYEKLKELTRGRKISRDVLDKFIDSLKNVPPDAKKRMKALSVANYTGLSEKLVDRYFSK
ncbi:MAG: adenylosuccinate lyase [Proteobacteria bacterium]|nr:adenylosuccinate lyase [Pseudomonadota bacterium]